MNILSKALDNYIASHSSEEDAILKALDRETHLKVLMPQMLSGHVQGSFLSLLSTLAQPKRILEIGTFTGYATICLAKGMSKDGLLYTIDINQELETLSNKYFEKAGLRDKIISLYGNAMQLIPDLKETFDLVFIDADKSNYANYYDLVFNKVRTGGLIIADNVLWSGKVVDEKKDKDTLAMHLFNQKIQEDQRVENVLISVRDGLMIARKK